MGSFLLIYIFPSPLGSFVQFERRACLAQSFAAAALEDG